MEMRDCKKEDLPCIMNIANLAWKPIIKFAREQLGDKLADIIRPEGDDQNKGCQVKAQAESGAWTIKVCVHEGNIVGFITYQVRGNSGEIGNNAALPGSGLKGVGQCMYRAALKDMRSRGVQMVRVTTGLDDNHAPARRAYQRAGFKRHLDSVTYYMDLDEVALD